MKKIIYEIELEKNSGIVYEIQCAGLLSRRFLKHLATKPKIDAKTMTDEQEKKILQEYIEETKAEWRLLDGDWQTDFEELPPGIAIDWLSQLMKHSTSAASVKLTTEKN